MKRQRIVALVLALLGLQATPLLAGAWTLTAGQAWFKASWFQQSADEWYIDQPQPILRADNTFDELPAGTRQPYRFNGEYESKAVFLEGFYGVTDWLDVGVQVPWFDQVYDDDTRAEPPADAGFSDLRGFVKVRLLENPAIVTLKTGVKAPTGEFRNEDGLIPVGEGQWDYDIMVQVGRSFWPLPAYGNIDVGYRVRTENEEILRDPGDEWLFNAELGAHPAERLLVVLKLEVLHGLAGSTFGIENDSLIQRIAYVAPTVSWRVYDRWHLEGGARISVNGRNFPAGHQLTLGLSTSLDGPRLPGVAGVGLPWQ